MSSMRFDVLIVGAGIVGVATARALLRLHPDLRVAVFDKEPEVGRHQTGHNSGVLHSGLYYRPGSLKASLCVTGQRRMAAFCEKEGLAFRRSGKIVVATKPSERPALDDLHHRGTANGLEGLRVLGPDELVEVEPHATGLAALLVPEAGVADYGAVARRLSEQFAASGGTLRLAQPVTGIVERSAGVEVEAGGELVHTRTIVNCAGLQSDRIAALAGVHAPVQIVPFRGEYYTLTPEAEHLVRALIYPVPDPRFPFLGVHFTRRVDGSVEVGPNAVLALGREHYRGESPDWGEVVDTVRFRGFQRLVARYWRTGIEEAWRSAWPRSYARSARTLVPDIRAEHLQRSGAGVRAQAVTPDGRLVDDFSIVETDTGVHVLNAPSPAATASLAIGDHIARLVDEHLH